jgi:hypothetical protein
MGGEFIRQTLLHLETDIPDRRTTDRHTSLFLTGSMLLAPLLKIVVEAVECTRASTLCMRLLTERPNSLA